MVVKLVIGNIEGMKLNAFETNHMKGLNIYLTKYLMTI